jgi:hypothetical protein
MKPRSSITLPLAVALLTALHSGSFCEEGSLSGIGVTDSTPAANSAPVSDTANPPRAIKVVNQVGISLGPDFSNASSDKIASNPMQAGFCAGLNYEARFGRYFALQPAVMFAMKSASWTYRDGVRDAHGHLAVDGRYGYFFIEIPVLLKLRIPFGSVGSYWAGAGPGISFDPGHVFDMVAQLATGATFAAGPGDLVLDVRYSMGLNEVGDGFFVGPITTRALLAMVGYSLNIGKNPH